MANTPFSGAMYSPLDRGRSYKAKGVRRRSLAEMVYFSRNDIDLRGDTDAYHLIGRQLDKRMSDAKAELAESIRQTVETQKRSTVNKRIHSVRQRENRAAKEALDPEYGGGTPRSRVKGKGRSVAVGDVYKPALELREDEVAARRIGSLTGGQRAPRQSSATMLSRFGANKDMGGGLLGASASRMRGAKNLMAHPETWLARFAPFWIAKEVSNGIQNWRNWDKVSFAMSTDEAKRAMGQQPNIGDISRSILGTEASIVGKIVGIAAPIGAAIGATILPGKSEADAARATDLIDQYTNWAGSGFKGDSPSAAMDKAQNALMPYVESIRTKVRNAVYRQWDKNITDGLETHKDMLARRGVGGINTVRGVLRRRSDMLHQRDAMLTAANGNIDYEKLQRDVFNRYLKQFID